MSSLVGDDKAGEWIGSMNGQKREWAVIMGWLKMVEK